MSARKIEVGRRNRRFMEELSRKVQDAVVSSSTYLNLGLSNIGGLEELEVVPDSNGGRLAYQVAHDDLGVSTPSGWSTWDHFWGSTTILRTFLNASCRGCAGGTSSICRTTASTSATASSLTTSADDIVKRLIKLSRHID